MGNADMKPGALIAWFRSAEPGARTIYYHKPRPLDEPPPAIFATASQLGKEGGFLYQKHGQYGIMKLSHRAQRLVRLISAHPDWFAEQGV